ncbi:MAG: carboxypeptidase-like regulatory domain-containing protein [Odoribacter sp.]|nr:carboxypeptidase-like regulatory domain-containing protein [Odoribacter sp.]MDE6878442.1 carboxypeptidase-like regulatory domain-containing protein [Odoribacter sp.]
MWLFTRICLMMGLCCSCSDDNPPIFATLSGTVTDYETGELLEDVMVTLTPLNITQRTDKTGSFCFDNLDVKQYTIAVQKAGYHPNRKNVDTVSGEDIEVNITMTRIENEGKN